MSADIKLVNNKNMIKWLDFKLNKELSLQVDDDNGSYKLKVKIIEYEWDLHRHPFIADIKVIESNNTDIYPIESVLRLPIETKEHEDFLLSSPVIGNPAREFKRKGFISILN